jgi:hypothetical protein
VLEVTVSENQNEEKTRRKILSGEFHGLDGMAALVACLRAQCSKWPASSPTEYNHIAAATAYEWAVCSFCGEKRLT